jgi:hypothetical protein
MELVKPLVNHYRLKVVDGVFAGMRAGKAKYGEKWWFLVLFWLLGGASIFTNPALRQRRTPSRLWAAFVPSWQVSRVLPSSRSEGRVD